MANKKISGYTEVTTYDDTSFYLLENSSGYYRKQSSNRLTRVITSSVTYTIGTGGDFANFVLAMDFLKNKLIPYNVTVTLQLCSDLVLSTPASYTWPSGKLAALEMEHPCSSQIYIDLSGHSVALYGGCGFYCGCSKTMQLINSSITASDIKAMNLNVTYGVQVWFGNILLSRNIRIGYNSSNVMHSCISAEHGHMIVFNSIEMCNASYGVNAHSSFVWCESANIHNISTLGFYADLGSNIDRRNSTGDAATSCSPAIGSIGNYNSYII